MRLLDLFCGAGGAAMGYSRAGFTEIVGVDIKPQPMYPFTFVHGDATVYPLDGFDAIHASPPCQAFTAYRRKGRGVGDGYLDLIAQTRDRLRSAQCDWVIENVYGAPLRHPVQLCGSSFGLDVRRHRYFESNCALLAPPCDHAWQRPRFPRLPTALTFAPPSRSASGASRLRRNVRRWVSTGWNCRSCRRRFRLPTPSTLGGNSYSSRPSVVAATWRRASQRSHR